MGFQVGRSNNNSLIQGFNTAANIKLANEELEEKKTQFDTTSALEQARLKLLQDEFTWNKNPDNPLNASRILANQQTQTDIDDVKKQKILDNVLQSGTGLLEDKNLFSGFEDKIAAKDLFIKNDSGDYVVNPSYSANLFGFGDSSGVEHRKSIQNQLYETYADDIASGTIDKGDIDEVINKNWVGGENDIWGGRYQSGTEAFNKYLSEAYSDDIQNKDIDVDKFNKMIGTNPELFNTLAPGLMLAGQSADKLGYGLGGNTIPFNLTGQG